MTPKVHPSVNLTACMNLPQAGVLMVNSAVNRSETQQVWILLTTKLALPRASQTAGWLAQATLQPMSRVPIKISGVWQI